MRPRSRVGTERCGLMPIVLFGFSAPGTQPVLLALKFQTPSSGRDMAAKWDFVMVRRLTARLPPAFQASICPAHSLHIYSDEVGGHRFRARASPHRSNG